jgi:hypothetical protein
MINVNKYSANNIQIQKCFLGPKIPINQFLNRLPKTVIKNGQVIDIRENIEQHLTVSKNQDEPYNLLA